MESFMPTKLRAVLEKFRIFGKCLTPRCVTQFSTKTRKSVTRVSVSLRYSVTTTEKLDSALCLPAQSPTSRCKVQCRLPTAETYFATILFAKPFEPVNLGSG